LIHSFPSGSSFFEQVRAHEDLFAGYHLTHGDVLALGGDVEIDLRVAAIILLAVTRDAHRRPGPRDGAFQSEMRAARFRRSLGRPRDVFRRGV
jgi:hypothetical protein